MIDQTNNYIFCCVRNQSMEIYCLQFQSSHQHQHHTSTSLLLSIDIIMLIFSKQVTVLFFFLLLGKITMILSMELFINLTFCRQE